MKEGGLRSSSLPLAISRRTSSCPVTQLKNTHHADCCMLLLRSVDEHCHAAGHGATGDQKGNEQPEAGAELRARGGCRGGRGALGCQVRCVGGRGALGGEVRCADLEDQQTLRFLDPPAQQWGLCWQQRHRGQWQQRRQRNLTSAPSSMLSAACASAWRGIRLIITSANVATTQAQAAAVARSVSVACRTATARAVPHAWEQGSETNQQPKEPPSPRLRPRLWTHLCQASCT